MELYILLICFFLISMVYSSVGFGGGSSYLALMGVMAITPELMRPTSLLCNIVVVTGGTIIYYKEKLIDMKRSWPFLIASIPCAIAGGYLQISERTFFLLLGATLVVASLLLWLQGKEVVEKEISQEQKVLPALGIGGGIGFLSGMVSIGGGIFLSPVLHLMRWDNAKKISALASLFILVNSIGGLAGKLMKSPQLDWKFILPLMLCVFAGGQIGSRLGARKFNILYIKRITAVLILLAGLNILKDNL